MTDSPPSWSGMTAHHEPVGSPSTSGQPPADDRTRGRTVLLLADEGLPSELAERLAAELPAHLHRRLPLTVRWSTDVRGQVLPLSAGGEVPMAELADEHRRDEEDLVLLLTDLPRRAGTQTIASDFNVQRRVGLISVPALGLVLIHRRARELAVHLIERLVEDDLRDDPGHLSGHPGRPALRDPLRRSEQRTLRRHRHHRRWDVHVELPGLRGQLRLLGGLVRDNRPWRLVPKLSSATAASAAVAAFGLVNTSFWMMAQALAPLRLSFITTAALVATTVWLLVYNHLWDRPTSPDERRRLALYNASTVITLLIGVTIMYVLLFTAMLAAAAALIDSSYFTRQLGHPVGPFDYMRLVWLSTSMGVVAGALGSSLDGESSVREATYGSRERQRRARGDDVAKGAPRS